MSEITEHYTDWANPDLPATNAELRALIAAKEFENAALIAQRMTPREMAVQDEKGQTVLHLLAVYPECPKGIALMQQMASRMPSCDIVVRDKNDFAAADLAFYAGHAEYKRLLQTFHRFPLGPANQEANTTPQAPYSDPVPGPPAAPQLG